MEETAIVMTRSPQDGFPKDHLLANITKDKPYLVIEKYIRSFAVIDEINKKVWISGKMFKKYFKLVKKEGWAR